MSTVYELEHDINTQLIELHERVLSMRAQRTSENDVHKSINDFMFDSCERLDQAKREKIDRRQEHNNGIPSMTGADAPRQLRRTATLEQHEIHSQIAEQFSEIAFGLAVALGEIRIGRFPGFNEAREKYRSWAIEDLAQDDKRPRQR